MYFHFGGIRVIRVITSSCRAIQGIMDIGGIRDTREELKNKIDLTGLRKGNIGNDYSNVCNVKRGSMHINKVM